MKSKITIEDIQEVIDALESIAEKRIRAEQKLETEMEILHDFGCDTINKAEKKAKKQKEKIEELYNKFETAYNNFIKDYNELFK